MSHVALIRLPWPEKRLSPNSRAHWASKANATKWAKETAFYAAMGQSIRRVTAEEPIVSITFHPPDKRRRDLDNCLASLKAALDGIATAWGVDDSRWALRVAFGEPTKGGAVLIECRDAGVTMIEHRGIIR